MERDPPLLDSELLGEIRWLRRLAGALVLDAASADDLVQQALLQALERRDDRHAAPLSTQRAWLRVVLRHGAARLFRTERRRAVRESRAAPPSLPEPPDELVARAELHRCVTTTLLALDEPYRHALLLRYLDDLSPPQIAERLALPLETVRTRLKRGLRLLRERLEVDSSPRAPRLRQSFALSLLSLLDAGERHSLLAAMRAGTIAAAAGASGAVAATNVAHAAGGALMTTTSKWIAATIGLLAVAATTWLAWPEAAHRSLRDGIDTSAASATEPADAAAQAAIDRDQGQALRVAHVDHARSADDESAVDGGPTAPLRGRVVDEQRRPVAGAAVQLSITDRPALRTRTDAAGRFALQVPKLDERDLAARGGWSVSLAASDAPDGIARAGSRSWFHFWDRDAVDPLRPEELEQALVVHPAQPLRVQVRFDGERVAGALVRLELGAARERGPEARSDGDGVARFAAVPAGPLLALARVDSLERPLRGRTRLDHEGATAEFVVELRPARRVAVTVRESSSDAPIARARIGAVEHAEWQEPARSSYPEPRELPLRVDAAGATTDLAGRGELLLDHDVSYFAFTEADGFSDSYRHERRSSAPLAADAATLSLFLTQRRREPIVWRLDPASHRPPNGELRLLGTWLGHGGRVASALLEDDAVAVEIEVGDGERVLAFQAFAIAADGSMALLVGTASPGMRPGSTIAFRPSRTLEVELRSRSGAPLADRLVTIAADSGEMAVLSDRTWRTRTDRDGRARFESLPAATSVVRVDPEGGGRPWLPIGEVDLTDGDRRFEWTAGAPAEVHLEITIDGKPGLPDDLEIETPDLRSLRREEPGTGRVTLSFPAAETLSATVRAKPLPIRLRAPGFTPFELSIPFPSEGAEAPRLAARLERETELLVRFVARPDAVLRPTLEKYDEARASFESVRSTPERIQSANAGTGRYRFVGLAAGRYRIVDEVSRVTSGEVLLEAGEHREVEIDLQQTFELDGTIEWPSDVHEAELHLRVVSRKPTRPIERWAPLDGDSRELWHDGRRFRATLERGRRWWLVAWLPFHRLAGGDFAIELDASRPTLELRFEARPIARFIARGLEDDEGAYVTVSCFEPGNREQATAWCPTRAVGSVREFAPPIGTHDLVLHAPGRVPVVRRSVEFTGAALDLGAIVFDRGSTLTVRIVAPDGRNPIGFVRARPVGAPPDERWLELADEAHAGTVRELSGVSAGTWRIEFVPTDDFAAWAPLLEAGALQQEVEVDGKESLEVALGATQR